MSEPTAEYEVRQDPGEGNPSQPADQWAIVEIMGHVQTAGRISRPSDWGGLLRVDVPDGDRYRTEFYGFAALYSVKLVSEQIARAYAQPVHETVTYDAPIVTREQHQAALSRMREHSNRLEQERNELQRRLLAIQALPAPQEHTDDSDEDDDYDG